MKFYISVRKAIFTVLFSFLVLPSWAQVPGSAVSFANEQFFAGNYSSALIEYQRALFFGTEATGQIYQRMADCSYHLKKYDQAIEFYDRAFFTYSQDSLKVNALLNKAKCNIVTKNYNIALIDLLGITDSLAEKTYRLKQFYIGMCYFGTEQFPIARDFFIDAINPSYTAERAAIATLFENKKLLYRPDPHTAFVMSICFPGLGQFYAGDIKNGLNSLLLSTGLVALGIQISVQQSVLDGIFTIIPWFQRYYQGGYMRAEKIAMEKRASNRGKLYGQVLDQISSTK